MVEEIETACFNQVTGWWRDNTLQLDGAEKAVASASQG
jgi:hypothetical protein